MQFVSMVLCPFRRAEEAGLFSIPAGVDNSPLRMPAGACEFTHGTCFFHQCNHSGNWVCCSHRPAVTMVTAHDPLIWEI